MRQLPTVSYFLTCLSVMAMLIGVVQGAEIELGDAAVASGGVPRFAIVFSPDCDDEIRSTVESLRSVLSEMTGAVFAVREGDGAGGIVVGVAKAFPGCMHHNRWEHVSATEREDYLIQTHSNGVYLLGATPAAARHAVWDFLYRLGYRHFFPGENWEIIPQRTDLFVNIQCEESPDYKSRRIWYGYGAWDYAKQPYREWCEKNRCTAGFKLNTGHSYGRIISEMQSEFDGHPEFYALVDGKRHIHPSGKFCISNPLLRKTVEDYAAAFFEKDPAADCISMDPSDGGGWCECEHCVKMGSVSDRAVTLANQVAIAINRNHDSLPLESSSFGRAVGMYAYNFHSPPPTIPVDPNVVVSVATGFIKCGYTVDDIVDGWSAKNAMLGIREYYSVHPWDRDLPGKARGGNLQYLTRTIPEFHRKGARFMSAESSDNWGPNGIGYYVASRLLWDIEEASDLPSLTEDFLTRCFGDAKEPMRDFYHQLDGSQTHLMLTDQIGRMFKALQTSQGMTSDPAVHARIRDLLLYTQYVRLFHEFQTAKGDGRNLALETLIRYSYRIRKTMMVHVLGLYRDLPARESKLRVPDNAAWNVKEKDNPWKSSAPFTSQQMAAFLSDGIQQFPVTEVGFDTVGFSNDLIAVNSTPSVVKSLPREWTGRGKQEFWTWADEDNQEIRLTVTGGLIAGYRDRGNVKISVWQYGGASDTGELQTKVDDDDSVTPDGTPYTVVLRAKEAGLYRLTLSDGRDMTRIGWGSNQRVTVQSSLDKPLVAAGRWSGYFFVPQGTKLLGFFGGGRGRILDAAGKLRFSLEGKPLMYHSIAVPPGTDGSYWRVQNASSPVRLMTVPPYFAKSPKELLLPKEIMR